MERTTPRFQLAPRPSRTLARLLLALHGAAAAAVFLLPWPVWAMLPLLLPVAASCRGAFQYHILRSSRMSPLGFGFDGEGWFVVVPAGRLDAELQGESVCLPAFTLLRFRCGREVATFILLPDSARGEELRQLRARLKVHAQALLPPAPETALAALGRLGRAAWQWLGVQRVRYFGG